MKGWLDHPELGRVIVSYTRAARAITARWCGEEIHVTVPAHLSVEEIQRALTRMAPQILAKKPSVTPNLLYREGSRMEFEGLAVEFHPLSRKRSASARPGLPVTIVDIGSLDTSLQADAKPVSGLLKKIAAHFAEQLLLPRAAEVAREVGVAPAGWKISRGTRTLGTCSQSHIIALSSNLVFLPLELRDYIVKHELAHLSEMNHSPRFHALCNAYCNGREKELERQLRAFSWPVIR